MAKQAGELTRTVTAGSKYVRISPYKVREVAALIKGKQIDEARRILAFTPKAASHEISKVLESAIANAEHNFQIPQDELIVKVASADEGVTIKRFRARAQGRGYRIRKRTCHINLTLERKPQDDLEVTPRARRPQKPTTTKPVEPTTEAKPKRSRKTSKEQIAEEPKANQAEAEGGSAAPLQAESGRSTRPNKRDQAAGTARIEAGSGADDPDAARAAESEPESGRSTRPNERDQAAGTARIEAGSGADDPDAGSAAESPVDDQDSTGGVMPEQSRGAKPEAGSGDPASPEAPGPETGKNKEEGEV